MGSRARIFDRDKRKRDGGGSARLGERYGGRPPENLNIVPTRTHRRSALPWLYGTSIDLLNH